MNIRPDIRIAHSTCPHDCPSVCALDVELLDSRTIGRVRGSADNSYTLGVVCEKVGRYAERVHHPDRLLKPLKRKGAKGAGEWQELSWDDALDEVAEAFLKAEARHGSEAVWPYYFAGTMGLVMRDGLHRLRHAKRYSVMYDTICVTSAWPGYIAGTGKLMGPDPREMAKSDLIVIWGTNPVHTQVNVMAHVTRARKERGARLAVVDVYETATMKQADLGIVIRPGTDGALACAVMHVLFRDGFADRAFLEKYTDCPKEFEAHLQSRGPEWASVITGLAPERIVEFAHAIGGTPRTYIRIGYGFTRSRNGAVNMHAVTSIASVTGSWVHEGGGAFHNNGGIFHLDKTMIEGLDVRDDSVRWIDQCRIGAALNGDPADLKGGPPVTAMLIQNTNPVSVAPDQEQVKRGFARDDLFVCVHEQFMTETADVADIVLPATMFLEHDDVYQGGGHQHMMLGPKLIDPPGECRSNHEVHCELAKRVGAEHPGFSMSPREHIDWLLRHSGWGTLEEIEEKRWIDCQPPFEEAHFRNGFKHPDGKFRFRPDWKNAIYRPHIRDRLGPFDTIPAMPDHWEVIEEADEAHPFRLATSPARNFLNTSFNETPTSLKREGRPTLFMHSADLQMLGIDDGAKVRVGNRRGRVLLHVKAFKGIQRGVVISESIWPNASFEDGRGINTLTGSDPISPSGGGAFHDNRVWVEKA
ncbi:MAG: molybdopterin-dependent oxidoreductase [Parvibaculaceae bacterium]